MTPLILTAQEGGERLDAFVASQVEGLTRSAAQRLLEQGAVTSGGKPLKKNAKTTPGMVVEVLLPDPQPVEIVPQNIPLNVVYEDDDVIVVNKPVGLVVIPLPDTPTAPWSTPCSTTAGTPCRAQRGAAPGHCPPH